MKHVLCVCVEGKGRGRWYIVSFVLSFFHHEVRKLLSGRKTFDIIVVLFIDKNMYILHHNLYNVTMFTNL